MMKKYILISILVVFLIFGGFLVFVLVVFEDVVVENVWFCVFIGVNCFGVVYMMICNIGDELVMLIGFIILFVMMFEIYEMKINVEGVSFMSLVGEIVIVLGESVVFELGGLYVMLMWL